MNALKVLCFTTLLFTSQLGFALPGVNNGGGGWMCKNLDSEISWIFANDLVTERIPEFAIPLPQEDFRKIFAEKRALIKSAVPELEHYLARHPFNFNEIEFVEGPLEIIHDTGAVTRPPESLCARGFISYVQVINYLSFGKMLIDKTLWNNPALANVDKAALLHEVIYKAIREEFSEETSYRVREIVSDLFRWKDPFDLADSIHRSLWLIDPHLRKTSRVPLFPFRLACSASVKPRYSFAQPTHQKTIYPIAQDTYARIELPGFRFTARSSPWDAGPEEMEIVNLRTGARASLSDDVSGAAFVLNQEVTLTLGEHHDDSEEATLRCWASTEKF